MPHEVGGVWLSHSGGAAVPGGPGEWVAYDGFSVSLPLRHTPCTHGAELCELEMG
eukprot:gene27019-1135_t